MRNHIQKFVVAGFLSVAVHAEAATLFVNAGSPAPAFPYSTWETAATNIQDAIDAATAFDVVLVTNGTYQTGGKIISGSLPNRVAVTKPITVMSVNGPADTRIVGSPLGDTAVRGVYLTHGASLIGFHVMNGGTRTNGDPVLDRSGGGIWCASWSAVISNCWITGNGAHTNGGGAFHGTLYHCILSNNVSGINGGGGFSNRMFNCVLAFNLAGSGGGVRSATLTSCVLTNNRAQQGAGSALSTLTRCTLAWNVASGFGGGSFDDSLDNCLLYRNSITPFGNGGGAFSSDLNNCTVVFNSTATIQTPVRGGGLYGCSATNTIVQLNDHLMSGAVDTIGGNLNHCCVGVLQTPATITGTFSSDPLFLDDLFHLQPTSPCIDTGNSAAATGSVDVYGRPRAAGAAVDIGATEFQGPGFVEFLAWLAQYGLPGNGTADFADTDVDGMHNWGEWRAGTVPIDDQSVLKLHAPADGVSGIVVTWQSVSGITYVLERSTNLLSGPFSILATDIPGLPGTTSFTDTTVPGNDPVFYRVGVQ